MESRPESEPASHTKAELLASSAPVLLQVAWTRRNVVVYPAICSLAGLVAGMFGVGGGIVKVPPLLGGCFWGIECLWQLV